MSRSRPPRSGRLQRRPGGGEQTVAKFGDTGELLKCSFCGKSQKQVKKLIAGPGVYICDECIDLCNEIIEEELTETASSASTTCPNPREVSSFLDDYVVGQEAQEDPRRRRLQPLQADPASEPGDHVGRRDESSWRSRTSCCSARPGGQDPPRADTCPHAERAVRDRRRHGAHRSGLRRRGRREHPAQADPGRRLRREARRDRHHLHRRDRQGRPQEREPVDHP